MLSFDEGGTACASFCWVLLLVSEMPSDYTWKADCRCLQDVSLWVTRFQTILKPVMVMCADESTARLTAQQGHWQESVKMQIMRAICCTRWLLFWWQKQKVAEQFCGVFHAKDMEPTRGVPGKLTPPTLALFGFRINLPGMNHATATSRFLSRPLWRKRQP